MILTSFAGFLLFNERQVHSLQVTVAQNNQVLPPKIQENNQTKQEGGTIKGLFADYDPKEFKPQADALRTRNEVFARDTNTSIFIELDLNKTRLFNQDNEFFKLLKDFSFKEEKNVSKETSLKFKEDKSKPRLSIIIDDMASSEQVRWLKASKLKLTPSFFPPDKNHPRTHILAKEFDFFMVHLPLAAMNFKNEEIQTLKPEDDQEHIDLTVDSVVRDFAGIKFINNHTGSLFTSDIKAMRKLFQSFQRHGLIFVDSITIGSSKASLVAKEFGQIHIKRDIFLDNEDEVDAIKKQIKKAVNLAHKKGFAIAIAHPRKNTFKALTESKKLLETVNLVYLSEVFDEVND